MSRVDDAARDALSEEDREFLARLNREPSFAGQIFGVYRGPMAGFNIFATVVGLLVAVVAFFAAWKFIAAAEVRAMLLWGALSAFCFLGVALIRIWLALQVQTNRVLRELKRLELQVARLAQR